jgi:hypothetical protein
MSGLEQDRRPWARRSGRAGALAVSLAAHAAIGVALVAAWTTYPAPPEQNPIAVTLVDAPRVIPPPPPVPAPAVSPAKASAPSAAVPSPDPAPAPIVARPSPAPPQAESPPAATSAKRGQGVGLSDSEYAGASSAGEGDGAGGQACHMAQRVQAALRRDSLVQAAVAEAGRDGETRAIMVWNGDWVQSPSQDGKGLAAVREAIMWEIAFAPESCRAERMRGLVLLSLNGTQGVPRLAVGAGDWRWADLLAR